MSDNEFKLPTGKSHVSFSELLTWHECSWRHKKKYIENIELDKPSPYTIFGSAFHASCEVFLKTRVMDADVGKAYLNNEWTDEFEQYRLSLDEPFDPKESWLELLENMVKEIPDFLETTFPNWEFISAEQQLYESIEGHIGISFKGYIDGVLSVPDKRGKKKIWIIDFKTASWGWARQKKQDFGIQMQPRLYKHFWAQRTGTPPKDIRCGFLLVKRNAKNGKRCELVTVSGGELTTKRSLELIDNMVHSINRGLALKNRNSCRFCEYKDTEHCP